MVLTTIYIGMGLVLGLVFFIAVIKAYTLGISHGKVISSGGVPQVKINPVSIIKQKVDEKKEKSSVDAFAEGWSNIFAFDGSIQKGADKE
jgi:hypothetical protein